MENEILTEVCWDPLPPRRRARDKVAKEDPSALAVDVRNLSCDSESVCTDGDDSKRFETGCLVASELGNHFNFECIFAVAEYAQFCKTVN